jgi:hypothetical protein
LPRRGADWSGNAYGQTGTFETHQSASKINGYRVVAEALAGATDEELDARQRRQWTAREIVHHLADSEMTSAIRLRLLIAVDTPQIVGLKPGRIRAAACAYDRLIEASIEAFKAARRTTAEILERMSEAEWAREGDAQRGTASHHYLAGSRFTRRTPTACRQIRVSAVPRARSRPAGRSAHASYRGGNGHDDQDASVTTTSSARGGAACGSATIPLACSPRAAGRCAAGSGGSAVGWRGEREGLSDSTTCKAASRCR